MLIKPRPEEIEENFANSKMPAPHMMPPQHLLLMRGRSFLPFMVNSVACGEEQKYNHVHN